jgi:hypothetical protein
MATIQLTTGIIKVKESREDIIGIIETNTIDQNSVMYGSYGGEFITVTKENDDPVSASFEDITLNPQYIVYIE